MLFFAILVAVAVAIEFAVLHRNSYASSGLPVWERFVQWVRMPEARGWITAVAMGLTTFVLMALAPDAGATLWVAPILLLASLVLMSYLVRIVYLTGDFGEIVIPILLMVLLAVFTVGKMAYCTIVWLDELYRVGGSTTPTWLANLVTMLPWSALTVTVALSVRHLMIEMGLWWGWYRWAVIVVAALAIIAILLFGVFNIGQNWQASNNEEVIAETPAPTAEVMESELIPEPTPEVTAEPIAAPVVEVTWYHFRHYDLLEDDDLENDFNFGPSAYAEGMTAQEAMDKHWADMEDDPALFVASMANFDVYLGTDLMVPGTHYDQDWSDGYWTTIMNEEIQCYMANEAEYRAVYDRAKAWVYQYASTTLDYETDVRDQMYMVSIGGFNEAPEVIVAKTDQPTGHILRYNFRIKGNDFAVPFRAECDFQPTNVAGVMKETPQENPINPGGNTPSGGGDTPSTVETPVPTAVPESIKNPADDAVNQGNADKGGGENESEDGPGEAQPTDARLETPTGPEDDNHHGYSDPTTVTPTAPPVVPEHTAEPIVTYEEPMNYEPDPVSTRGPVESGVSPTTVEGDGEFTPDD